MIQTADNGHWSSMYSTMITLVGLGDVQKPIRSMVCPLLTLHLTSELCLCTLSPYFLLEVCTYTSCSLGWAKPRPCPEWWLWPSLGSEQAKATSGQAKARAFRPGWAGTSLSMPLPTLSFAWPTTWCIYKYDTLNEISFVQGGGRMEMPNIGWVGVWSDPEKKRILVNSQ